MINTVLIMGRMVANPELKQTASGTDVTSFIVFVDFTCPFWGTTPDALRVSCRIYLARKAEKK